MTNSFKPKNPLTKSLKLFLFPFNVFLTARGSLIDMQCTIMSFEKKRSPGNMIKKNKRNSYMQMVHEIDSAFVKCIFYWILGISKMGFT